MAKCANCGKSTSFGHNRSFSLRATNRTWKPNLQTVSVLKNGRLVKQVLCTKCIKVPEQISRVSWPIQRTSSQRETPLL